MQSIIGHIFHDKHLFLLALKQKFIKNINKKYQRNKQKSNILFS